MSPYRGDKRPTAVMTWTRPANLNPSQIFARRPYTLLLQLQMAEGKMPSSRISIRKAQIGPYPQAMSHLFDHCIGVFSCLYISLRRRRGDLAPKTALTARVQICVNCFLTMNIQTDICTTTSNSVLKIMLSGTSNSVMGH